MKRFLQQFPLKTCLAALLAAAGTAQLQAAPGDVVFSETFDEESSLDAWTIKDLNGGRTWEYLRGKAAYMLD